MNARGRPKKNFEDQLCQRVGTRLSASAKRKLEYISEREGIAVETLVRSAVLLMLRTRGAQAEITGASIVTV